MKNEIAINFHNSRSVEYWDITTVMISTLSRY